MKQLTLLLILSIFFGSCSKDDENEIAYKWEYKTIGVAKDINGDVIFEEPIQNSIKELTENQAIDLISKPIDASLLNGGEIVSDKIETKGNIKTRKTEIKYTNPQYLIRELNQTLIKKE